MVLLPKQWKSRSSPGFAGGVKVNPFAVLKSPPTSLSRGGVFVYRVKAPKPQASQGRTAARTARKSGRIAKLADAGAGA